MPIVDVFAKNPCFRFREARRYSNIDVCEKIAPPIPARRRSSELTPNSVTAGGKASAQSSGIVCTNTDLLSIMNSLKSTANKALQKSTGRPGSSKTTDSLPITVSGSGSGGGGEHRRDVLRNGRSNSVDVANLSTTAAMTAAVAGNTTRNWFRKLSTRAAAAAATAATTAVQVTGPRMTDVECCRGGSEQRPVTIGGGGEYVVQKSPVVVTFADERPKVSLLEPAPCKLEKQLPTLSSPHPILPNVDEKPESTKCGDVVVWDRPTGSIVNAKVLGTAIEGFLAAKKSGDSGDFSPSDSEQPGGKSTTSNVVKAENEPNSRNCDTSICSSLKDLFVK